MVLILQSGRSRTCGLGRHPMQAVGPQFDQLDWRCRPIEVVRARQVPVPHQMPATAKRRCSRCRRRLSDHHSTVASMTNWPPPMLLNVDVNDFPASDAIPPVAVLYTPLAVPVRPVTLPSVMVSDTLPSEFW